MTSRQFAMRNMAGISAAFCAALISTTAMADVVHLDDVIIDGSLCVGFDCVNGESFGFDTIRLKENNLRIKFDDTSAAAGFPNRDWQITVNDSASGGANKFSIEDITGGRTPFTIEGNAPSHSLFVDDAGRVGLGTSTPVVELQIVDGDTPTLRLQQDGSSGFAPQTWDVAGNETNFFVRDVTNGSTLPLRIRPGAPSSSIFIDTDGDVGIATSTPSNTLHVRRSNGTAKLRVEEATGTNGARDLLLLENTGNPAMVLKNNNNNNEWTVAAGNNFLVTHRTSGVTAMTVGPTGDVTIPGSITTGGGTCGGGCDLVFADEGAVPNIEEHARQMWEKKHLPNVGPTIENQPFNLTDKTGRILNELEIAHIYIAQLHERIVSLESKIETQR